jgi:GcrA cell cycle regulator
MAPRSTIWSPPLIERFLALHAEGLPFSAIARELNVSRNAVIGKAHRLALPSRAKPQPNSDKRTPTRAKPRAGKMARAARAAAAAAWWKRNAPPTLPAMVPAHGTHGTHGIPLHALESFHCRWPVGYNEQVATFCGAQRLEFCSYCSHHAAQSRRT